MPYTSSPGQLFFRETKTRESAKWRRKAGESKRANGNKIHLENLSRETLSISVCVGEIAANAEKRCFRRAILVESLYVRRILFHSGHSDEIYRLEELALRDFRRRDVVPPSPRRFAGIFSSPVTGRQPDVNISVAERSVEIYICKICTGYARLISKRRKSESSSRLDREGAKV